MQTCQRITRKSASNLALAFILLPKEKRRGMAALYAFCRQVDDQRRARLAAWRADIQAACQRKTPQFVVNQELQPVIARYHLPLEHFEELLRGVAMDLDTHRYADFEALEQYCYRVASVVGLLSIEIFGYRNAACRDYAIYLGKALQLTNILRDVCADARRGRIYLPASEMERHSIKPEDLLQLRCPPGFVHLGRGVAQRARHFYQLARQTLPEEDRRSMVAAELMGSVYWRLLRRLEQRQFAVFDPPVVRIGKPLKLLLILRAWCGMISGSHASHYGSP